MALGVWFGRSGVDKQKKKKSMGTIELFGNQLKVLISGSSISEAILHELNSKY